MTNRLTCDVFAQFEYLRVQERRLWDGSFGHAGAWPGQLSGHWVVIVGISDDKLSINNPLTGMQTWDYDFFMSQYLIQDCQRPLVNAP